MVMENGNENENENGKYSGDIRCLLACLLEAGIGMIGQPFSACLLFVVNKHQLKFRRRLIPLCVRNMEAKSLFEIGSHATLIVS
jgi:hypothetical protein